MLVGNGADRIRIGSAIFSMMPNASTRAGVSREQRAIGLSGPALVPTAFEEEAVATAA